MKVNGAAYAIEIHQDDVPLPYLFMLHGFMGDGRVFHHLIDDLRSACNPVTIDLLGHGKSGKIHDFHRYKEEQQIADIIQIVEKISADSGISDSTYAGCGPDINDFTGAGLGAGGSVKASAGARAHAIPGLPFLYGYSMGGRLALKTALQAPKMFAGLILESTNPGIKDNAERAERRTTDAMRARRIKNDYPAFLAEWEDLPLFKSPLKPDEKLENKYKEIHLAQDAEAMAASLLGFGTGSMKPVFRDVITNYKNPAMVVAGTEDQKYMKISQSLTSYFEQANFCPIPAGHRVHLDNPSQLSREITQFTNQNSSK